MWWKESWDAAMVKGIHGIGFVRDCGKFSPPCFARQELVAYGIKYLHLVDVLLDRLRPRDCGDKPGRVLVQVH